MLEKLFYGENLLVLLGVSITVLFLGFGVGYWIGQRQRKNIDEAMKSWITAINGTILGMLSLLLAFSFGMAEQRFDARKQLVVDEANAIGTTYLRAQWLPEPDRTEISDLLRLYVDARLPKDMQAHKLEEVVQDMVVRSEQLQDELWLHAIDIAKKNPASPITALFLDTLNNMIDLQTKRLAQFQNRVPESILLLLYVFAVFSILITGYVAAFGNRLSFLVMFTMIGLLALLLTVIIDLDRSQRGLIRVSHGSLIRLQQKLNADLTPP